MRNEHIVATRRSSSITKRSSTPTHHKARAGAAGEPSWTDCTNHWSTNVHAIAPIIADHIAHRPRVGTSWRVWCGGWTRCASRRSSGTAKASHWTVQATSVGPKCSHVALDLVAQQWQYRPTIDTLSCCAPYSQPQVLRTLEHPVHPRSQRNETQVRIVRTNLHHSHAVTCMARWAYPVQLAHSGKQIGASKGH